MSIYSSYTDLKLNTRRNYLLMVLIAHSTCSLDSSTVCLIINNDELLHLREKKEHIIQYLIFFFNNQFSSTFTF